MAGMLGMVLGWRPALAQKTQGMNEFKALCLDTARLRWAWTQIDTLEYDSLVLVPLMMEGRDTRGCPLHGLPKPPVIDGGGLGLARWMPTKN